MSRNEAVSLGLPSDAPTDVIPKHVQVSPLRINKTPTASPAKSTSRPLSEIGSGERRRNSPSFDQTSKVRVRRALRRVCLRRVCLRRVCLRCVYLPCLSSC